MSSNGRLLRKLRRVMGAAVTLPSLVACSSQICCAGVYECSINKVNYIYDDTEKRLTISGLGKVTGSLAYVKGLQKLGAEFPKINSCYDDVDFCGMGGIEHVIIKDGITEIGKNAFDGLMSLKDIVMPDSVTKIGECAFDRCVSLTEITIPEFVEELQDGTFGSCIRMEKIKLPGNLRTIGNFAFSGCKNLRSITIPESVEKLGKEAFERCGIVEITIPHRIGATACGLFLECNNLKTVKMSSSIQRIGSNAFRNCENLSEIEFYSPMDDLKRKAELKYPNDPKGSEYPMPRIVIYPNCFAGCKKLGKISLPLNTRFKVGEENGPVTIEDIILHSDKLKNPCGCCLARYSKLSDFFEPNMEVEIGGKTYRVK